MICLPFLLGILQLASCQLLVGENLDVLMNEMSLEKRHEGEEHTVSASITGPPLSSPRPTATTSLQDKNWDCVVARQGCETAKLSLDACSTKAVTRLATTASLDKSKMIGCLCSPDVEQAFYNCMVVGVQNCLGTDRNATMMASLWSGLSCSISRTLAPNSTSTMVCS
jgi:hypothetical protein